MASGVCRDTPCCIMTGEQEMWPLAVSRYNTARAAIRQGRGLGLQYNFCIIAGMRPTIRTTCARDTAA